MKTIVIVHHTGEWGGGTKSLIDLCEMLCLDFNVIVAIPKGYPEFCKKIIQYGCKVYEINSAVPFTNIYSGRPPLLSIVTLRSIKSLFGIKRFGNEILTLKPDVVIFNTIITSISSVYLYKFTKVVCIDRETQTGFLSKLFYKILLCKRISAITFLSEYEKHKMSFQDSKSLVFPDCVRTDKLVEMSLEEVRKREHLPLDKFVVLFMGGLAKIKGTDVILKAFDSLDDRFLLVFAGMMDENLLSNRQLIHDIKYPRVYLFKKRVKKYYYKLKSSVKFYETGLRNSIDELIIASDLVVFPSTSVHQPRPCIEAGAYKKPVIISDYKETEEYFIDGYNALTFKTNNSKDLKQKIIYAYENKDLMNRMGENNRLMTETKHNFYKCKAIINSLIAGL